MNKEDSNVITFLIDDNQPILIKEKDDQATNCTACYRHLQRNNSWVLKYDLVLAKERQAANNQCTVLSYKKVS